MKSIPESQTDLLFSFSQICLFFADPDVFFHKGLDPYQSKKSLYILSAPKLTAIMHLLSIRKYILDADAVQIFGKFRDINYFYAMVGSEFKELKDRIRSNITQPGSTE